MAGVGASRLVGSKLTNYVISKKIARSIATGHALTKHLSEFSDLGITTERQLINYVSKVIRNPNLTKELERGRIAYYDTTDQTLVIFDPNSIDLGTSFRVDIDYYNNKLK